MINRQDAKDAKGVMIKFASDQDGWSYEEKVVEIETIIAQIEGGSLELQEVFDQFTKAVKSLRECESFLKSSQQQVDLLIETLQDD